MDRNHLLQVLTIMLRRLILVASLLMAGSATHANSAGQLSANDQARISGSTKLQTWRGVSTPYNANAPVAVKSGSGEQTHQATKGFTCQTGQWAMQGGTIRCLLIEEAGVSSFGQGKVVLVNLALPVEGSSTGTLLRLVGGTSDLRVDIFDQAGTLRGSCYVITADRRCDLGSPSTIHPNLALDPRYLSGGSLYSAFDLVSANRSFAGSLAGTALQDSYVVSVRVSAQGLHLDIAGIFYSPTDSRGASFSMMPIYASATLGLAQMAAMPSGSIWTAGGSRNAPTGP